MGKYVVRNNTNGNVLIRSLTGLQQVTPANIVNEDNSSKIALWNSASLAVTEVNAWATANSLNPSHFSALETLPLSPPPIIPEA